MKIKCWVCGKKNKYTNPDVTIDKAGHHTFTCEGCGANFVMDIKAFQEFTFEEMEKVQEQIKNKSFEGKLICGSCQKEIDPYEDDYEFSGIPKLIAPDEEDKFELEKETFNPICRECHDKMWGSPT